MKRWIPIGVALLWIAILSCGGSGGEKNSIPSTNNNPAPVTQAGPQEVRFFTFGDWGTGTASQSAVAEAVTQNCMALGCDFGLFLGDNFYPTGVSSTTDPLWQSYFEKVYADLPGPFYAVLGNHDYDGNPQAEVDYTALQTRWKLPARAYSVTYPVGAQDPLLEIFVIDSNAFDAASAVALQNALDASRAVWKLLALHHPIYSNGPHGDDSIGINSLLIPVICEKIDAVLSGHDHLFSHLDEPDDGCNFPQFVVGTGGKDLYSPNPDSRVLYSESSFGFAVLEVTANALRLEFRRADGSLAYAFAMQK